MTNEKLYEVLGDINEKHVYEARAYHKAKKSIWANGELWLLACVLLWQEQLRCYTSQSMTQ